MKELRWRCRDRELRIADRPLVMGILNVTPDSFSDGGRFLDLDRAVEHGVRMAADGADILDVGGESTRPGAASVDEREERERVTPVIRELARRTGAVLSVDTMKAGVARDALAAGAHIVNDVSAFTVDPAMAGIVAAAGAGAVLMHMRGTPGTMQSDPRYDDVVAEVRAHLEARAAAGMAHGIERDRLAVDPGIGFGKTVDHNLALLAGLPALAELGWPVVVGLSRKSFLGKLTGQPVEGRLAGSLAGAVFSALKGAHVLRVHDVRETADALRVMAALCRGRMEREQP